MSTSPRSMTVLLAAGLGAALLLSGCERESARSVVSISPELAREAEAFGGWVVPVGSEVLASARDVVRNAPGAGTVYRMAVATSPDGLRAMLAASRFSAAFSGARRVLPEVIAGPPLQSSPSVVFAEDRFRNSSGQDVSRAVVVDERDAATRNVHLEFRAEAP